MLTQLRRSAVMVIVCLVLFGLVYPLVGTGVAQLFFKGQADGSITPAGSTHIGQNWSQTRCPGHLLGSCVFQGRPDDLGPYSDVGNYKGCPTPMPSTGCSPVGHPGDDPLDANERPNGSPTARARPALRTWGRGPKSWWTTPDTSSRIGKRVVSTPRRTW